MKIKYDSDHELPPNKTIEICIMTTATVVTAVFLENINYY